MEIATSVSNCSIDEDSMQSDSVYHNEVLFKDASSAKIHSEPELQLRLMGSGRVTLRITERINRGDVAIHQDQ